ncbi:hypothetical protein Dsin_006705 [Dipteronia sinensis]|uniref:Core domain-containing protein n=1 Tax=Dipteronia sinensis TaxID=43782 RepID=A0AAE0AYV3_9ROSI|nr:hypothetical protein Dsin_006705 [Dipteronia sinensis]
MKELQATENGKSVLSLGVETGGCSGLQYVFDLDDKINQDDRVFEREGIKLVIDDISYDFVKAATTDYVEELIRSAFVVIWGWPIHGITGDGGGDLRLICERERSETRIRDM